MEGSVTVDGAAFESLLFDVDDGVATVTFNRPEAHNAVSVAMVEEMYEVLQTIAGRSDVRVVVLTGAGDRFFNPGAELGQRSVDHPPTEFPDPRTMHSCVLLREMPQVTLAAVNGSVAGAGFGWMTACDLRVASSTAMFATAFLDVGVAGDLGVPWSLERIVGGARNARTAVPARQV